MHLLSVEKIEIHVALLVADALVLFVETVACARAVGQVAYGVFGGTLAVFEKRRQFFRRAHGVGIAITVDKTQASLMNPVASLDRFIRRGGGCNFMLNVCI